MIRVTASVCAALICAFAGTGFVTSAYEGERTKLGDRHFRSGQKLTGVNDLTGAAEEFRKALLFSPDMRDYRLALATALVSDGKLEEAQSHLEQLSEEDPTNGRINLLLARVARQEHHPSLAIESYQRAVYEYWPPDELSTRREARWELIDLLEQTGRNRDQLVGELLQLYANLPPQSSQRMKVGAALLRNGADSEAAHVFRDVLKDKASGSEQMGAHLGLARVWFRAGDYIEARHEYQRILRGNAKDAEVISALQLTNDIIDISPQLPNISANERLHRSQSLLNRVEADIQHCAGTVDAQSPLAIRLHEIEQMEAQRLTDKDDAAARLQLAAQQLWKDRASFCGARVNDAAIEAVLPRLGDE